MNDQKKFCKFCGVQLPKQAIFCSHCGGQVELPQNANVLAHKPEAAIQKVAINKKTQLVLLILFGGLGFHKFYEGKHKQGGVLLGLTLLSFIFPPLILAVCVWWIIDFIKIIREL